MKLRINEVISVEYGNWKIIAINFRSERDNMVFLYAVNETLEMSIK